jgi:quinol monooxygenase YgiN
MAVLIKTKVKGQTTEGYNGILSAIREPLRQAPGFIMHCAHPAEEAWDVYEVWQSKAQADQWFAKFVIPNLPTGIHPKRTYEELHSIVTSFE